MIQADLYQSATKYSLLGFLFLNRFNSFHLEIVKKASALFLLFSELLDYTLKAFYVHPQQLQYHSHVQR